MKTSIDSAILHWINEHQVHIEVDSPAYRALAQTIKQLSSAKPKTPVRASSTDLLGVVTAKTVDFNMAMWRDQDSSCLLCNTPMGLDAGAEWPADPRLLLCWGCMSELCSELITKLETTDDQATRGELRSAFDQATTYAVQATTYAVGDKVLLPDGQIGIITGTSEHGTTGTVAPANYAP
jgi:hypothetical protein